VSSKNCRVCVAERAKRWRQNNPERFREAVKKWEEANPEKKKQSAVKAARKWQKNNPEKHCAINASRRAKKHLATPKWLTDRELSQIDATYLYSKVKTRITGIQHHVDHIVPLKGATVCGLHVPWNLRVIPALENIRKKNKLLH
jgi:hypothetical protein